jgi:hypothetical protein
VSGDTGFTRVINALVLFFPWYIEFAELFSAQLAIVFQRFLRASAKPF